MKIQLKLGAKENWLATDKKRAILIIFMRVQQHLLVDIPRLDGGALESVDDSSSSDKWRN